MTPAEWPICVELLNRGMLQKNPQAEENVHTSTCGTIDPLWIWRLLDVRKAIGISRSSLIKVYPPFCGDGIEIQHCSVTDVALHSAKGSGAHFAEISRWRQSIRGLAASGARVHCSLRLFDGQPHHGLPFE